MTANAVTDGLVAAYTKREFELRQRFLKGVLDPETVLDGLQRLMEMTEGWINCNAQPEIPSWAHKKDPIIQHVLCGMVDPSRLSTVTVFEGEEEVLNGETYLSRAQRLDSSMNACALDFYARPENWKYLPTDVDVIVFPKTVFRDSDGYRVFPKTVFRNSDGNRCVRYLYRRGSTWYRYYDWLDSRFSRNYRVAVLAS